MSTHILEKKQTKITASQAKAGYLVLACFLILASAYGYQRYRRADFEKEVSRSFVDLVENQHLANGEIRPTGGFQFGLIGTLRETDATISVDTDLFQRERQYALSSAETIHKLGTLHLFNHNLDRAEEYYRKALLTNQENARIRNDLAVVQIRKQDYEQALENLQTALRLDPTLPEASYNLALVYEMIGDSSTALKVWNTYLRLSDGRDSGWRNVAKSHILDLREY